MNLGVGRGKQVVFIQSDYTEIKNQLVTLFY